MPRQNPAEVTDASSPLGDEALVRAALDGDARALRALWDRYAPLARRVIGRSLGPRWEVEDLVQDVFLALFKNLRSVREPAALRAFLVSICVRTVRQELRKYRLRRLIGLRDTPELEELRSVSIDYESRQALNGLYRALERLPFRERTAFVLRRIEGMELDEIAAALALSTPTIRRSLAKASERLSHLLRHDERLSLYFPVRE